MTLDDYKEMHRIEEDEKERVNTMECTCHINPPCGYRVEKEECAVCGEFFHPSEGGEFIKSKTDGDTVFICEECLQKSE